MQNQNSQNGTLTELTTKSIASSTYPLRELIQKRKRKRRRRKRKKQIIRTLGFPLRLHKIGTGYNFDQSTVDFKNTNLLCQFLTKHGRIFSRRRTGLTIKNQRRLSTEIKIARIMGLFPFQFYGLPPKDDEETPSQRKKYRRKYKRYTDPRKKLPKPTPETLKPQPPKQKPKPQPPKPKPQPKPLQPKPPRSK
jgi:ribosomal protein S18